MKTFHYMTLPASEVTALLGPPAGPGAFVAEDQTSNALRDVLSKGYRWTRTDGDMAIFEKEVQALPERVREALDGGKKSAEPLPLTGEAIPLSGELKVGYSGGTLTFTKNRTSTTPKRFASISMSRAELNNLIVILQKIDSVEWLPTTEAIISPEEWMRRAACGESLPECSIGNTAQEIVEELKRELNYRGTNWHDVGLIEVVEKIIRQHKLVPSEK